MRTTFNLFDVAKDEISASAESYSAGQVVYVDLTNRLSLAISPDQAIHLCDQIWAAMEAASEVSEPKEPEPESEPEAERSLEQAAIDFMETILKEAKSNVH